jgi:hypothetical protein
MQCAHFFNGVRVQKGTIFSPMVCAQLLRSSAVIFVNGKLSTNRWDPTPPIKLSGAQKKVKNINAMESDNIYCLLCCRNSISLDTSSLVICVDARHAARSSAPSFPIALPANTIKFLLFLFKLLMIQTNSVKVSHAQDSGL